MFDPHFTADPNALPPALRAVSLVLALAIIGAILFQNAATAAATIG
jgi:hypothetical protein